MTPGPRWAPLALLLAGATAACGKDARREGREADSDAARAEAAVATTDTTPPSGAVERAHARSASARASRPGRGRGGAAAPMLQGGVVDHALHSRHVASGAPAPVPSP